jgi:CRISPR-associated endonuclease/helicase Cas3
VIDIGGRAAAPYSGQRAALRLHPAVWPDEVAPWAKIAALLESGATAAEIARATGLPEWSEATGLTLAQPYGDDPTAGAVLVAPKGLVAAEGPTAAPLPVTEGDEGLFAPAPVKLDDHARAVAGFARRHAEALGLPDTIAEILAAAGRWHDDGKADPRFQLWLRSIEGLTEDGPPIAKTTARVTPARQRALRAAASLPDRWRHEVASVRLAAVRIAGSATTADPELLLWLIGTHHGHGRPFFPHDDDWDAHEMTLLGTTLHPAPGPDKLDFDQDGADWAGLMERLRARYGLWGLAFLEACLRLADHRASAGETL